MRGVRWVCPRNGHMVADCPTCHHPHRHKREELLPAKPKEVPVCETHNVPLVRAEEKA